MSVEPSCEFPKARLNNLIIDRIMNKTCLNPIITKHLGPPVNLLKLRSTKTKRRSTSGTKAENEKLENNHFWIKIKNHNNLNYYKNDLNKKLHQLAKTPKKLHFIFEKNYQLNLNGLNYDDKNNRNKNQTKLKTHYIALSSLSMAAKTNAKGKNMIKENLEDEGDITNIKKTNILNLSQKLNENLHNISNNSCKNKRDTFMKLWENKLIKKNKKNSGKDKRFKYINQKTLKTGINCTFYNLSLNNQRNFTSYFGSQNKRIGTIHKLNMSLDTSNKEKNKKSKCKIDPKIFTANLHKTQENMLGRVSNFKKNEIYLNTTNRSILRSYNGRNYKVRDAVYENYKYLHNKRFIMNHPIIKLIEQNMGKIKIHDMIFGNSYINSLKGYNSACKEIAFFDNHRVISPIHINYNSLEEICSTK